jgi:hypothetical protein
MTTKSTTKSTKSTKSTAKSKISLYMDDIVRDSNRVVKVNGVHTFTINEFRENVEKQQVVMICKIEALGTFPVLVSANCRQTAPAIKEALNFFGVRDLRELETGEFEAKFSTNKDFVNIDKFILE